MTQNPPTYESATTNGSSRTTISPEVGSTVLAVDGGYSPPANLKAPDASRSALNAATSAKNCSDAIGSYSTMDSMVGSVAESCGTVMKNCMMVVLSDVASG